MSILNNDSCTSQEYYELTGSVIYPDIPIKTFTRSKVKKESAPLFYPNPFTDRITITLEASAHLSICELTGKSILEQAMEAGTSILSTSSWQLGMYIVTLRRPDGNITTYKLIK